MHLPSCFSIRGKKNSTLGLSTCSVILNELLNWAKFQGFHFKFGEIKPALPSFFLGLFYIKWTEPWTGASQAVQWVKNRLPKQETQGMQVRSLHLEDPLEKGMAMHSSILA